MSETPTLQVKLFTVWQHLFWPDYDDFGQALPAELRAVIDPHHGHDVMFLHSVLGWRALHCHGCDTRLWTHPEHQA